MSENDETFLGIAVMNCFATGEPNPNEDDSGDDELIEKYGDQIVSLSNDEQLFTLIGKIVKDPDLLESIIAHLPYLESNDLW